MQTTLESSVILEFLKSFELKIM